MLWLKAFHVVSVIAWFAAIFYLPRLFVYHCDAEKGSQLSETFKVMERRLLRFIMNPAMVVVWVTGLYLAWVQGMVNDRWLWAKFALVVALVGVEFRACRVTDDPQPICDPKPAVPGEWCPPTRIEAVVPQPEVVDRERTSDREQH